MNTTNQSNIDTSWLTDVIINTCEQCGVEIDESQVRWIAADFRPTRAVHCHKGKPTCAFINQFLRHMYREIAQHELNLYLKEGASLDELAKFSDHFRTLRM